MHDLVEYELVDLHSSAEYLLKVLKRMASKSTNPNLKQVLDTYYSQAEYQKRKFADYFGKSEEEQAIENCLIMSKIQDYANASMRYPGSLQIQDTALILAANVMKKFEKTAFGTAISHENRLNREETSELLLILKKKIAEEDQKLLDLALSILNQGGVAALKQEAEKLHANITLSQIQDLEKLLAFLPEFSESATSQELKNEIESWKNDLKNQYDILKKHLLKNEQMKEIPEWQVISGYIEKFKEHLESWESKDLIDLWIIITIQRMQHLTIALLEVGSILLKFSGKDEAKQQLDKLLEKEINNDKKFTAISNKIEDSL